MWVRLDDQFHSHPKLAVLGSLLLPCVGLHALALSWCGCHLTDGAIPREQVARLGAPLDWALVQRLVDAEMWETANQTKDQTECDKFIIHDYLEYNLSRRQVMQLRRSKVMAGQAGGKASAQARAQAKSKRKSTPSPSPSPSPETSDVEHPRSRKEAVSADPSPDNGRGSAVPIDPQLIGWLHGTKNLRALADPKRGDFWAALERAYDRYDWFFFEPEIANMDAWIEANPQRRPTERGLPRFVRSWFERAVNMGRTKHGQG